MPFEPVLEFFSKADRQRRMEESEIHHDRCPLAGVVRDQDDDVVPNVDLTFRLFENGQATAQTTTTRTNAQGAFRVGGMISGGTYRVLGREDDHVALVVTGIEALENSLVDQIGYIDDAISAAFRLEGL